MQYIDRDGNRHDIPLHTVQPIVSPDSDNALYESANGLKVPKSGTGSASIVELTQTEYDALPESQKQDPTTAYFVDNPDEVSEDLVASEMAPLVAKYIISPDSDNKLKETSNGLKVAAGDVGTKSVPDQTVTNLTLPEGLTGTITLKVKNDIVSIAFNGVSGAGVGLYAVSLPVIYRPIGTQYCSVAATWSDPTTNVALVYVDNQAIKLKVAKANTVMYGSVTYAL